VAFLGEYWGDFLAAGRDWFRVANNCDFDILRLPVWLYGSMKRDIVSIWFYESVGISI
jgi:hypothetical protein